MHGRQTWDHVQSATTDALSASDVGAFKYAGVKTAESDDCRHLRQQRLRIVVFDNPDK
jgi:hypothetical protein